MIIWTGAPPWEVEQAVDQLLDPLVSRLPPWCRTLYVTWNTDSDSLLADIDAGEEYRWATLTIYPKLLDLPVAERRRTLAHEIAHVYLNRLDAVVSDIIETQTTEGPARDLARAVYDRACEAVTEDLAGLV